MKKIILTLICCSVSISAYASENMEICKIEKILPTLPFYGYAISLKNCSKNGNHRAFLFMDAHERDKRSVKAQMLFAQTTLSLFVAALAHGLETEITYDLTRGLVEVGVIENDDVKRVSIQKVILATSLKKPSH